MNLHLQISQDNFFDEILLFSEFIIHVLDYLLGRGNVVFDEVTALRESVEKVAENFQDIW